MGTWLTLPPQSRCRGQLLHLIPVVWRIFAPDKGIACCGLHHDLGRRPVDLNVGRRSADKLEEAMTRHSNIVCADRTVEGPRESPAIMGR